MEQIRLQPTDEILDLSAPDARADQELLRDEEGAADAPETNQKQELEEATSRMVGRTATGGAGARDVPRQREPWRQDYDYMDETNIADPVRVYLNTIGRSPLLKANEEVELSKTIEIGLMARHKLDEAKEAGQEITGQLGADLRQIAREGERAKKQMLNSNLRLVVYIVKHPKYARSGMHLLDRIQEGNVGLIRAVEKFDYEQGIKFSTYATWWIKQAIQRAIPDQAYTVRLPVHQYDVYNSWRRISRRLGDELGREPTNEEVLAAKREEAIQTLRQEMARKGTNGNPTEKQILTRTSLTLRQIEWAKNYKLASLASLDAEIGIGDTGATLQDVLADTADDSEERQHARERHDLAHTLLDRLRADEGHDGPRMAEIVVSRMKDETLEEIGNRFGLSRERVRQLEKRGQERLAQMASAIKTREKYFE